MKRSVGHRSSLRACVYRCCSRSTCRRRRTASAPPQRSLGGAPSTSHQAVLQKYCVTCHNEKLKSGGLALSTLDLASVSEDIEPWEHVDPQGSNRSDAAGRTAAARKAARREPRDVSRDGARPRCGRAIRTRAVPRCSA